MGEQTKQCKVPSSPTMLPDRRNISHHDPTRRDKKKIPINSESRLRNQSLPLVYSSLYAIEHAQHHQIQQVSRIDAEVFNQGLGNLGLVN